MVKILGMGIRVKAITSKGSKDGLARFQFDGTHTTGLAKGVGYFSFILLGDI